MSSQATSTCSKVRSLLLTCLLPVPALIAQEAFEPTFMQVGRLARERTTAPVATFDKESFKPDTVFRSKTLLQWTEALRDADTEGTAWPAKKVWLAMGPRAVPFLVAAQATFDWDGLDFSFTPQEVCAAMGEKAVEPLVRLLGSEHTFIAWMILGRIISDSGGAATRLYLQEAGLPPLSKEAQMAIDLRLGRIARALEPCLGSSDAATRLAGLLLLRSVAIENMRSETWGVIPIGTRRLLEKDPRNEVRGAACELLVLLGLNRVKGGLSLDELKKMAHPNGNVGEVDPTLPREIAEAVAMGIMMHMVREMPKPAAPTAK